MQTSLICIANSITSRLVRAYSMSSSRGEQRQAFTIMSLWSKNGPAHIAFFLWSYCGLKTNSLFFYFLFWIHCESASGLIIYLFARPSSQKNSYMLATPVQLKEKSKHHELPLRALLWFETSVCLCVYAQEHQWDIRKYSIITENCHICHKQDFFLTTNCIRLSLHFFAVH